MVLVREAWRSAEAASLFGAAGAGVAALAPSASCTSRHRPSLYPQRPIVKRTHAHSRTPQLGGLLRWQRDLPPRPRDRARLGLPHVPRDPAQHPQRRQGRQRGHRRAGGPQALQLREHQVGPWAGVCVRVRGEGRGAGAVEPEHACVLICSGPGTAAAGRRARNQRLPPRGAACPCSPHQSTPHAPTARLPTRRLKPPAGSTCPTTCSAAPTSLRRSTCWRRGRSPWVSQARWEARKFGGARVWRGAVRSGGRQRREMPTG